MSDFKILKCPSCGSSMVETDSETLLSCSHCGSKLLKKDPQLNHMKVDNSMIKKLLYIVIFLILAIGGVFFWQSMSEPTTTSAPVTKQNIKSTQQDTSNQLIKSPISSLPTLKKSNNTITNDIISKSITPIEKPAISIVSNIESETIIGGKYWIITIRNDSSKTVIRPRVVMSLFDENNRRIGEHVGWAKQDTLSKDSETTILVLISKPPKTLYTSKMEAMATFSKTINSHLVNINIDDFIVNKENTHNKYTIVGDVSNKNDYRVDFIWVQAVAKNEKGVAIGLADAYVTHSSLAAQENSGFKISASTFISETPASWTLVAKGRKHSKIN